jgi:hypothetical protein
MLENRASLGGDYSRALLAPVLLGVKTEIGQARRFLMAINAEKAAFVPDHKSSIRRFQTKKPPAVRN